MDTTFFKQISDGIITVIGWTATIFKALINWGAGLPSEWKAIGAVFTIISAIAIFIPKGKK